MSLIKRMLFVVIVLVATVFAHAATETVDGIEWTYTVSDGKVSVGVGSYGVSAIPESTSGAITMPSTLGGYPVTSIGDSAFYGCSSLTSVTIPDSVTSIGYFAFYDCSSLTSVTIPDSVTRIGSLAFGGCSGLVDSNGFVIVKGVLYDYFGEGGDVVIPNSVTSIGDGAFGGCSSLTSVTIGKSVTSIGGTAFMLCSSLTSVTIPDSVTSIGDWAFAGCSSLTSVTIPDSVTRIGLLAFRGCSGLVDSNGFVIVKGVLYDYFGEGGDVVIPNSVTSIGDYAFYDCSSLTSITIPDGVTSIGDCAFYECSSLTSITIGDSVTSIGENAFYDCSSLTSVTIPNSVTSIGSHAFSHCSYLKRVELPETLRSQVEEGFIFRDCPSDLEIIYHEIVPIPTINPDWGYVVTKLGEKKNEVAVVFTNHTETAMTWTVPVNLENVQFLVVGGGGGGGADSYYDATAGGAGGGGGGVVTGEVDLSKGSTVAVTIGAGGAGGVLATNQRDGATLGSYYGASKKGGDSVLCVDGIAYVVAYGGGRDQGTTIRNSTSLELSNMREGGQGGSNGGSRGGITTAQSTYPTMGRVESVAALRNCTTYGNKGGKGCSEYFFGYPSAGGGGGATEAGYDAGDEAAGWPGGKGGEGLASDITGTFLVYGSGGGGASTQGSLGGKGGSGAGDGGDNSANTDSGQGTSALANQGGGGGGSSRDKMHGGDGGSGIVVFRYAISSYLLPDNSKVFPEITDDSKVASVLEGLADTKVIENITDAATYMAFREWVLGLEGVLSYEVKESSNLWLSYVLNTDKLIEGEVTESRLKVTSFNLSGENNLFSIKLQLDGVDVGDAATLENLLKVFAIEGAKELSDDSFSVNNVALDVVQPIDGEVEFVVTPRKKDAIFFFRARLRDASNGIGMNVFHEKVQLWEGGPYWATTNIGAEKPEDYGYCFWWGDTIGYKRENDKWVASDGSTSNFSFERGNTPTYKKDNSQLQSEGWITSDGVLALEHDAAHVHWGDDWRMPTKQEIEDLNNKCYWIWATMNGVNGYVVRGKGDYASNSIFLPCVGTADMTSILYLGLNGGYWSSEPNPNYLLGGYASWYIFFNSSGAEVSYRNCWNGAYVRPLQGFTK